MATYSSVPTRSVRPFAPLLEVIYVSESFPLQSFHRGPSAYSGTRVDPVPVPIVPYVLLTGDASLVPWEAVS